MKSWWSADKARNKVSEFFVFQIQTKTAVLEQSVVVQHQLSLLKRS